MSFTPCCKRKIPQHSHKTKGTLKTNSRIFLNNTCIKNIKSFLLTLSMKVIDSLLQNTGKIFSVEIEPPSLGKCLQGIFNLLDPLVDLGIRYIDITYHPEQLIESVQEKGEKIQISQRKKPGTTGLAGAILGKYGSRGV